jgi:hypothetical protein
MTAVACIIRQSQGSDDSISLEDQRESVPALANDLGDDDPDIFDYGVHTGFSRFVKTEEQQSLDANPRTQTLETGLQNGDWDYLVAYDDTRLARDQYFWVLRYFAIRGGVEIKYVADVPDDQLTFRVQRAVEAEVKRKEIEKSRRALERRADEGMHQGDVPFGLQFDSAGEYLERDPDEWDELVTIFDGIEDDSKTYADIVAEVDGIEAKGTITKIRNRRETYEEFGL